MQAYSEIALDCLKRMEVAWGSVDGEEQDRVLHRMHQHRLWYEYWRLELMLLDKGNSLELATFAIKCDRAAWLFCKILHDSLHEPELDLFSLRF